MATTTAIHRHVAMCPFPFTSHLPLMLLLSRKIAASSPNVQITFFTTSSTAATVSAAAEEGGRIKIHLIDSGLAVGAPPPSSPLQAIGSFVEVAVEALRKGVAEAEEEVGVKIGCIVADGMMTFACREIAEERRVKWVAMWSPSAGAVAAHMHTDLLRESVGGPLSLDVEAHKGKTVDRYIPGFPPIPIADLPTEILAVDNPIARNLHQMSLHLHKAAAIAVNSFDTLEPFAAGILNSAFPNKFLFSGTFALTMPAPPALKDPQDCLPWLDTHVASSVVYISFGSGITPPLEEFSSLAEALEASEVPFLWSLPDKFRPYLPQGFVERTKGKLVSWAPQMAVLGHVAIGAQLTHCGWNSVLESIVTGVPMICRPSRIADHRFDGRLVCDVWGIGVEIEGGRMTKVETMSALEKVLLGEEGKRVKEKINVMKRLAEEAGAHPDGSSTLNMRKFVDIILS